jgi:5-methylcytosine-specific restriction endonuclease McrA
MALPGKHERTIGATPSAGNAAHEIGTSLPGNAEHQFGERKGAIRRMAIPANFAVRSNLNLIPDKDKTMKSKKLDGVEVWKEFEDVATRLNLNMVERAVYSHLLVHTRLEGKLRERFTIAGVADKVGISRGPVREAIRRLAELGALRFVERSYSGHLLEVRLPAEVPTVRCKRKTGVQSKLPGEANLEQKNFLTSQAPRQAIHAREGGKCFYCRRRTSGRSRCLDHVVPRAKSGQNSYRNVVSCCTECNWQKKDHAAADFLRELYREGRLSRKDLSGRLVALRALAAGKIRPQVLSEKDAGVIVGAKVGRASVSG